MIYLDNAATSYPKPQSVYSRIDHVLRDIGGNPGRASHRMALEASRVIFNAREIVSRLLNIPDSSRVAFTKNATEAINIALKGLVKPGDHLVTTSFEHNSVAKTVARLEARGVSVTRVRPNAGGFLDPAEVASAITPETTLVCVTHASNVFGNIQPVGDIGAVCSKRGVTFMVDAAQTMGAMPVEPVALNIDVLAATGHKALFGPQGTGFLYLRDGVEPEPLIDGGTGETDTVLEVPDRLECGTMNMPGIGGLSAGVEYLLEVGLENIRAHEESLIKMLLEGLSAIKGVSVIGTLDASQRVGLVSFNIAGLSPAAVGDRLDKEFDIMVRTGAHCAPMAHREAGTHPEGAVRVSPGYLNKPEDIDAFLSAVGSIAAG